MNKRPNTRRSALEDELMAEITDQQSEMETGTRRNLDDPFSAAMENENRKLNIVQGHRRRHPDHVLQQHAGLHESEGYDTAKTIWEQALEYDDERVDIPEEYRVEESKMLATHIGLENVATDAYKKKKNKMKSLSVMIGM